MREIAKKVAQLPQMNYWAAHRTLTQHSKSTKIMALEISTKIPVLPLASLDISDAPNIYLRDLSGGAVLEEASVLDGSFRDKLPSWTSSYSVQFPGHEQWSDFWSVYKAYLN